MILVFLLIAAGCSAELPANPVAALLDTAAGAIQDTNQQPATSPRITAAADGTLEAIYAEVNPSVVHIQVLLGQSDFATLPQIPDLPGSPDNPSLPEGLPQAGGEGSGFVWDKDGHIVTNNHVVEGAQKITVFFADDTRLDATLVGVDPDSDLAVIKVDAPADQLHPVAMGDSTTLQVGELAIAIGNPFGQEGTMTAGIISALGRLLPVETQFSAPRYNIPDVIQTDAAINPGNSGGLLLNDMGEVVGVTTAIVSSTGSSSGIGFAVPSAIVQKVVPVLIDEGHYEHAYLGISGTSLTPDLAEAMDLPADQRGALVAEVVPDGPADKAGLQGSQEEIDIDGFPAKIGGDVITTFAGQPVEDMDALITQLARTAAVGDTVQLTILRDGKEEKITVTLSARPERDASPPVVTAASNEERAWLGINGADVTPEIATAMDLPDGQSGILVQQVEPRSPAEEAGLQGGDGLVTIGGEQIATGGDVIISVEGSAVSTLQELIATLGQFKPGDEVTLAILRDGQQMELAVTLGQYPG